MRAKGLFWEEMQSYCWGVIVALLVLLMTSTASAAPAVISFQPSEGSVAPLSATVTATFSEAMNSRTITPGSFAVSRFMGFKAVVAGNGTSWAIRKDGTVVKWGGGGVPAGLTDIVAIEVNGSVAYVLKGDGTVVTLGSTSYPTPPGLTGIVAVASGGMQTVALRNDGTVIAWGEGVPAYSDGCDVVPSVPAAEVVPAGLSGVKAIAVGETHVLALKQDGTVVAWGGLNEYGETTVPAGLSGVIAVAAGGYRSVALKSDGTVVVWGSLGSLQVPAGLTDVVAISAGRNHTVAVKSDGTVVAWGDNEYGKSSVPAGLTGVVAVDAGVDHTVALKSDGTFVGWGKNRNGEAAVPPGLSGVVAIDARGYRAVALKGNGTLADYLAADASGGAANWNSWPWKPAPADLAGVVEVAAGRDHVVARRSDGSILSWGVNECSVATVPAGLAGVVAVDAGNLHNVALKNDGTVVVWGDNSYGKTAVPVGLAEVAAVAAGTSHTVAVKRDGTVVAWGVGSRGQTTVPAGLSGVVAVAAGDSHNLALKQDGTVVAWGSPDYGKTTVPTGLSGVVAVAAGLSHSVALKNDGTVVAWGSNYSGESAVPAGLSGVVAVAAGDGYTAALKEDGTVVTWGGTGSAGSLLAPNSPYERPVAGTVTYDETTRRAAFTPSAPLERGATYTGAVNGARSSSGVMHADGVRWSFQTPELPVAQVTIAGLTQTYNGTPRVVTATTTPPDLPVRITYDGITAAPTVEGSYNVVASIVVPNDQNYQGSASAVLNVTPRPIILGNLNHTYDGTPKSATATSTTGLAVTLTYNGSRTPPTGAGSYTVVATDTRSDYVTGTLVIAKAPASMAISGLAQTYDGTPKAVTVTGTPATLQVSVTYNGLAAPPTRAGYYSVVATCTDPNYYAPQATATMVTAKAAATVSFSSLNQVHDGNPKVVTVTTTPPVPVSITYSNSATAPTAVGSYTVAATSKDPNYQLLNATAVLVVSERTVAVKALFPAEGNLAPDTAIASATFSEEMNPATLTPGSFTLSRFLGFKGIGAGDAHSVALRGDGSVVAWGANDGGRTKVPAGLAGVVAVAAGPSFSLALKDDGKVVAWGYDSYGETSVPAGLSGVIAVDAGRNHGVALKSDRTVAAWGVGYYEAWEEMDPEITPIASQVPAGLSGVIAVAAGEAHDLALKSDGTVVAWGRSDFGQASVPSGLSGVRAIAAGPRYSAALKQDGTVVVWGQTAKVPVPAGLSGVAAIAAGPGHMAALKQDGTVVCWGDNGSGQSTVPQGLAGVVAIDAGLNHTMALRNDGTLVVWGSGGMAVQPERTGIVAVAATYDTVAVKKDGTVLDELATGAPAGLSGVVAVAAGGGHRLALKKDGTVVAWGQNYYGSTAVPAGLTNVVAVATGPSHSIAVKKDGTVTRWGQYASQVPLGVSGIASAAVGNAHVVALKKDGTVTVWGSGNLPPAGLSGVAAVAAGSNHSVAVKNDGTVVAWGDNAGGQATVPAGLSGVVAVAAGYRHTVALKGDGTVVAWGENLQGQCSVPSGLTEVVAIAAGHFYTVALKKDGTTVTWGTTGRTTATTSLYADSVPGSVFYDAGSRTATFTPSAPLKSGSTYLATVNTGVRGSTGNVLPADVASKFFSSEGEGKQNQSITVTQPAPARTLCDSRFIVNAVASSGEPVAITASGSCSASNTTGSATIVVGSGGACYVSYSQAGNALYNAAPTIVSTTEMELKKQVITFDPLPDKEYGDPRFTVNATASSGGVSFASLTPGVCKVAGNEVTIEWVGNCTIVASPVGERSCCSADPVSRSFNVGPGGLHHFAVLLDHAGAKVAGEPFGITVKAQNVVDETLTSFSGTVNLTTNAGNITRTEPATFVNGIWKPVVTVTGAGAGKSITATGDNKSGTSSPFTVNPAAAVAFTVSAPTRATIATAFTVGVTAKDIYNNVATGYVGKVHFTSSDPNPVLPPDYQFTAADSGTRLFSTVELNTADDQTVTATDTLDPGIDGVSAPIAVTNDANHRVRVTVPAATIAGQPFETTVTVVDLNGNQAFDYRGTVALTNTDRPGEVVPLSFTETDNGSKTLTATFYKAGNQWMTAVDSQISVVRGTSGSIRVFPAAAAKVDFKPQPGTTRAGHNIAPAVAVRVLDQYGNLVTDSTAAVTLAIGSNPSGGSLKGMLTRDATGGIATFADLSIDRAGKGYTLTAASGSLTGATSNPFEILAGTFDRFAVSTIGTQSVLTPFTITVTAQDVHGNTVTEFTESARLYISAGSSLSPTVTGPFVAGVRSEQVTVNGGGSGRMITATRITGPETGVSNPFTVNTLNQTIRVDLAAPATAEDLSTFDVSAWAPSGDVAITTSGACTGSGNRSARITMTSGAGTCTVQYNQAGNWNYNAAPEVTSSTQATAIIKRDQAITIGQPAPPSAPCDGTFEVKATSSSSLGVLITTSGACTGSGTGSAIITVPRGTGTCTIHYDQPGNPYFNPAPRLSSTTTAHPVEQTITFGPLPDRTIGDASFQVSATATFEMPVLFTSLTQNVCTVSGDTVTLVGVGTCTIRAAQEGECCVAAPVERSFMVRPAAAAVLTVTAPTTAVAGVPFDVLVTAKDRYGNVATGYAGTAHITSTDPNTMIILPPDFRFTPELDQGVHLFRGVVLLTAGNQTITATDTVDPSISGISGSIRINPAVGRALKVTAPATATAGIPIDVVVTVEDIYQNVVTDYAGTLHLTSSDSQALLPADYTFVADDQGSKALTVTLKSAGDQTVTAADTEITGTSGSIRVGHAVAGGLRFEQQPTTVTAGEMIMPAPTVKLIDQYGNFVADSAAPVTVAIGNNPSSGTLSGTRTVNAVSGIATFVDLGIDMVGSGYTLTASSGDSSATSIAFDVIPGASDYVFSGFLPPVDLGKPFKLGSTVPIKFQLTDAGGAIVTSARACLELVRTSNEVMIGDPIEIPANKDEGTCFRVSEGVYIYNLDTTGLQIGTYHIHAVIDDTTTHMIGMALK